MKNRVFKRSLSVSPLENQIKHDKCQRQAKYSSQWRFCKVCGDKANIINYGALSCQSCKTFFRRNGLHPQKVRSCFFSRSCEINRNSRRYCTTCRLAKCFLVGMSSDMIRKEEAKYMKYSLSSKFNINQHIVHNQMMPLSQLSTYNLSHHNRSLLIHSEQKILLNVLHAFDIHSAIPKIRRIIEDLSTSSLNLHCNISNVIETTILIYTSMISFIKSTPDYQILTITEQCSLFERNLNGIINLYSALVFRDTGVINNPYCIKNFASIYGLEMMIQSIHINKQLDFDLTIIKLMLIILTFSSNCFMVDIKQEIHNDSLLFGTYRLLGSQNVYVEVLWKYITYQYGYYDSALRFARLIKLVLDLMKYSANTYMNNTIYRDLVDSFNQQTKRLLIINQKEQVLLWGKI